jgi:hypothetical protein
MAYSSTFDYDIFLSYGWAGSAEADYGARRWASDLRETIEEQLATNLGRPRIYFDATAERVGPIQDDIYRALEQSALLIFLVSPGSYRTTSWCQKEVTFFWDRARPLAKSAEVLTPEDRILKVVQSPPFVARENEPRPLRDLRTFNLFEKILDGASEVQRAANLRRPSARVRAEMDALYATVRLALEKVKDLEKPGNYSPSGKRVFLGATFSDADSGRFREFRRELLLEGHEVLSVTPLPAEAETEEDHQRRVERAQGNVNLAVHFVPHRVPAEGWRTWHRNPAAQQIRYSLLKSRGDKTFSVFLWKDPDQTEFDFESLQQVAEISLAPGDQNADSMIFGALKVNVKALLKKPPPESPPPAPTERFDVVIQHNDVDSPEAARIRDYIRTRHSLKAQFANPTLPKTNTERMIKKNKKLYYEKASRFLVLYGRTNDEWTNDVCEAMRDHIRQQYGGLVVVAPPPEPPRGKRFYMAPDDFYFATKHCIDGQYEGVIDDWLGNHGLGNSAANHVER